MKKIKSFLILFAVLMFATACATTGQKEVLKDDDKYARQLGEDLAELDGSLEAEEILGSKKYPEETRREVTGEKAGGVKPGLDNDNYETFKNTVLKRLDSLEYYQRNIKFSVEESHERITKVYQRLDWLESKIAEAKENADLNAVKGYYIFLPPFDNDKSEITGEQKAILDDFIKRVNAGEFIAGKNIDAYASSTGSDEYNTALSQKRAENTAAYLVKKLGPEKIVPWKPTIKWRNYFTATGHGKTEKYGDEKYNRRVRLEKLIQK